jgi:hypothetical protein
VDKSLTQPASPRGKRTTRGIWYVLYAIGIKISTQP